MGTPINELVRLDVVGPALAQVMDDDRWEQAKAELVQVKSQALLLIAHKDLDAMNATIRDSCSAWGSIFSNTNAVAVLCGPL